jgi:hypothetical protein
MNRVAARHDAAAAQTSENQGFTSQKGSFVKKFHEKAAHEKKSRALALLEKLCRPYFPAILDLILIWRGDAACARQGSSRDLDHQTLVLRPACVNIRRLDFSACHHLRQRMFKIRAVCEMIEKQLVSHAFVCIHLRGAGKSGVNVNFLWHKNIRHDRLFHRSQEVVVPFWIDAQVSGSV